MTLVRDDQGMSRVGISVLSISLALGGVVGSLLAPRFVTAFGRGNLLRASSATYVIAVLVYTSGGPLWLIAAGPFLGSLANSFASVGASAFLQERQQAAAQASITEANLVAAVKLDPGDDRRRRCGHHPVRLAGGLAVAHPDCHRPGDRARSQDRRIRPGRCSRATGHAVPCRA
jgi:hypothetical protein